MVTFRNNNEEITSGEMTETLKVMVTDLNLDQVFLIMKIFKESHLKK